MPLTKSEVDKHFTEVLVPMLPAIIRGISHKHKKVTDIDAAIAEAYIHTHRYIDTFENTLQLDKLVKNWVKMNIIWSNSQLNKLDKVNNQEFSFGSVDLFEDANEHHDEGDTIQQQQIDDDSDLEDKIELELWYNDRKALLAMYRAQEQDKVKQIIFDCFFNKGLISGVALGKHLGVGRDSGSRYIRELKKDIREFANYLKEQQ